ncbi:MAG TPA: argininosuccinate lyase [Terriglobales bacterium]|jgi:argininosuccinate lyase|nr:argininosuccinate lyase [Terriglobales bacterium]
MKMWSGRFRQPLDPEFEKWQRSFPYDQRLLRFELAASRAHANALEHAGVLSSEELSEILKALAEIGRRAESPEFLNDAEAEDVHHFVEKQLAALIGATGYKLHTGRSRNEQIATDLRLFVRHNIDTLQNLIADWIEAILARADAAGGAAMPSYTHLQPAEPVLAAHWLLAYAEMFLRDADRLADCRKRVNLCPLGSGAVAGATLNINRQAMAAELGFDGPTGNSMDATSDRDFAIEFVDALSMLALHLSRWSEEMILFSTSAYGFVKLPEAYSTGSSAMPQKKNPDLLELVRGKAARVMGCAITLQTLVKGLPLAYNKDLQETQEPLFESADTIVGMLPLVTGFMNAVEFDWTEMSGAAQTGFMNAWAAAAYLVERGVPSRLAHEAVGKAVALAIERGCDLQELPLADLQAIHVSFDAPFQASLGLTEVLALHDVPGGTAPRHVKRALENARERAAALRSQESLASR